MAAPAAPPRAASGRPAPAPVEGRLRTALWAVSAAVYVGAAVELGISEHVEGWRQWIALVAVAAGLGVGAWGWRRPSGRALGWVRGVSWSVAAVSALGVGFHLWGNYQFSREVAPLDTAWARAWDTLAGGNPAFAPGMLAVAAVLALAATWGHPAAHDRTAGAR